MSFTIPIVLLLSGIAVGLLFERWIVRRLKLVSQKSSSRLDDLLIDALKNVTTVFFVLIGAYAAVHSASLEPQLTLTVNQILKVASILTGTLFVTRLAVGFVNTYAAGSKGIVPSSSIFSNITRLIVMLIGVLIALQSLGISVTPVLTALGVGGLAVALALQDTLSNLFAGLQIIGSGELNPGDFIKLDTGEEGYVIDVAWRNTTIRELANNIVVIPNAKLSASRIRNFDRPGKELAVLVDLGVSYASDLSKVERITIDVAREVMRTVSGGVADFEPFIRFHTFADFSINFTVILRGKQFVDQYLIKHEFIKRVHKRYKAEGIEIPFPVRTLHVETVPEDLRLTPDTMVDRPH